MSSIYIHIPFCSTICSYCDFPKVFYNDNLVSKYLDKLNDEIKNNYKNELIKTIYIGGGTPSSLSINNLNKLFDIIKKINLDINYEFTFECNIENTNKEKLLLLKQNKVNRLSIGIQTFNEKYLKFLNRNHTKDEVNTKINLIKEIGFNNINIDLIYGFNNQTLEDLEDDLDNFLKLNINHISIYSLQIEPNTLLYINKTKEIDEELNYDMYQLINKKLIENDFNHYEVSNYSKTGYESKHNTVYWNNNEYYGFGMGASSYINNKRITNTKSITNYLLGKIVYNEEILDLNQILFYEFILGLRKIKGINKNNFNKKYNKNINDINIIKKLLKEKKLLENSKYIYINPDYIYVMNNILVDFIGENYE